MATRTQLQLEPLSGCIHEQMLQSEYQRQRRRIYTLCRWMLEDAEAARRMEMRIFLDAWRDMPLAGGDEHRLAEAFAARFRGLFAEDGNPADRDGVDGGGGIGLREAVRQLPGRQRLLYLLHELEGYPPEVLGEWLDLEPTYCSRLIHQARLQLREQVAA